MEYIEKTPNDLSKYIDNFHISVKKEFEIALTNIYSNEIDKYSEIIEHIVQLPFVQAIVKENTKLKQEILLLQEKSRHVEVNNDNKRVILEIYDKEVEQCFQNMDDVILNDNNSDEEEESQDEEESEEEEEEEEPDEPSADKEEDNTIDNSNNDSYGVESTDNNQPTFPQQCAVETQEEMTSDNENDTETEDSGEEEEAEVIELEIDGKIYYCDGDDNGNIYEDDNGDVGNIVGELKDGEAIFH